MQYLQRSTKVEALQLQRNWQNWQSYFTLCGEKKSSLQQLSFYSKGHPQVCDNHRGISLLSMAWKIIARVLLNRLNEHLERSGLLPESQCGFGKNRGTIDMIFTARQPGTECGPLHNLCRPYQSIWHGQSWEALENYSKVWLSCLIYSNGAVVPWWYACKGPRWWRVFWSISCDKKS